MHRATSFRFRVRRVVRATKKSKLFWFRWVRAPAALLDTFNINLFHHDSYVPTEALSQCNRRELYS